MSEAEEHFKRKLRAARTLLDSVLDTCPHTTLKEYVYRAVESHSKKHRAWRICALCNRPVEQLADVEVRDE